MPAETRVEVARHGGAVRVVLRTGLLAPRLLAAGDDHARVALLATTATLLGGDHARIEVVVRAGARLELTDVAGTVAYDGRGRTARYDVELAVEEGGELVWSGEPFVVAGGAQVERSTRADVADGGRLLLRETLVLGRSGEVAGALRARTDLSLCGRPALVEDLDLREAGHRDRPGVLGGHRVVDTLTLLGARPTERAVPGATVLDLAAPGSTARYLGPSAHLSPLPAVWPGWRSELRTR